MPKLVTYFACEICGHEYKKRKQARKCERLGIPNFKFEVGTYIPEFDLTIVERYSRLYGNHLGKGKHLPHYRMSGKLPLGTYRSQPDWVSEKRLIELIDVFRRRKHD